METWDAIWARRNVHQYTDQPIARETLNASLRRDGEHHHGKLAAVELRGRN
jgi:hypothetical protein